ncbi:MAG: hypothetical protein AAF701_00280 [Pseudomonadota bacterium]
MQAPVAQGQTVPLDDLFTALATAPRDKAPAIVEKIALEWSKSGSPTMDLLWRRGQQALADQDFMQATHHFTALTDHAPQFAAGWHGLATAYFKQDNIGPALDALGRTLALEPRHFLAMEGLMVILEQNNLPDQALRVAKMIQSIHPHHPELDKIITRLTTTVGGQST